MKIYISGPMSAGGLYPNVNTEAFNEAERRLTEAGYEVINPARHTGLSGWAEYMKVDIVDMLRADGVATLPEWRESRGAAIEVALAHDLHIPVAPLERWLLTQKGTR